MGGRKRLNLALQGGGAHGAYTWGVLDRLLEIDELEIVGISGTSAGAMNATVTAHGLAMGGHRAARTSLDRFWERTAELAAWSPVQPSPLDRFLGPGNMDLSPSWLWFDAATRLLSPYQLNPTAWNPLRDILLDIVDFDHLCRTRAVELFLCATNVKTGRIKVFGHEELSVEAVLASACLPTLFQAIEIAGEHYWDGGYMGNPPIFPLIYETDCNDVLIVQINPINIEEVPTTAAEILDRTNELAFNSSLMREMRAIHFVTRLIDEGCIQQGRYKRLNIHMIGDEQAMAPLSHSSKLNADREFLAHLRDLGREGADGFVEKHWDKIGKESSLDLVETFL